MRELTFKDKIDVAYRFLCSETRLMGKKRNGFAWKNFRKGAERGLLIARYREDDIHEILELLEAIIFDPEYIDLAEDCRSYQEWRCEVFNKKFENYETPEWLQGI